MVYALDATYLLTDSGPDWDDYGVHVEYRLCARTGDVTYRYVSAKDPDQFGRILRREL